MNKSVINLSRLGIAALFLFLYIIPLGVRPIINPDESRYAEIPREMLASGDWIVPRFNGLRYFEKPVLGYWMIAVSLRTFGENAFAARLPSALAVGISALIIFLLLQKAGRRYPEGELTGAAFLTSLAVFAMGTTNILDSGFSMFITAALASFFWGYQAKRAPVRSRWYMGGGFFIGLAFLIKGFVAFAVPALVLIPFLLWNRRGKELLVNYWSALAIAVLVVLPWGLAIYFKEPDFWRSFFWQEHINRFLGSEAQHSEPIWFFLSVIGWGAFPWVVLIPASISGLVKTRIRDPLLRFSICWFLFPLLFFSLSRGKLPTYILPCFPPLIIILIRGLLLYFGSGRKKIFNAGVGILIGVVVIIGLGLAVVQLEVFSIPKIFNPMEIWKLVIALAGIFIWAFFLLLSFRQKEYMKKLIAFSIAPAIFLFSSPFIVPDRVIEGKAPGDFLMRNLSGFKPGTILVSDKYGTGSLCWFSGRDDVFIIESNGEFKYGLSYPDSQWRRLTFTRFKELLKTVFRGKRVFLFLDTDRYLEYQPDLPRPVSVKTGDGFVLAEY